MLKSALFEKFSAKKCSFVKIYSYLCHLKDNINYYLIHFYLII